MKKQFEFFLDAVQCCKENNLPIRNIVRKGFRLWEVQVPQAEVIDV